MPFYFPWKLLKSMCAGLVAVVLFPPLASVPLLLGFGVAHAQSYGPPGIPSYIGPYVYSTYAASGPGGVVDFVSEGAAMSAQLGQLKSDPSAASYCNFAIIPPESNWAQTIYTSAPVEGVETAAERPIWPPLDQPV